MLAGALLGVLSARGLVGPLLVVLLLIGGAGAALLSELVFLFFLRQVGTYLRDRYLSSRVELFLFLLVFSLVLLFLGLAVGVAVRRVGLLGLLAVVACSLLLVQQYLALLGSARRAILTRSLPPGKGRRAPTRHLL
jgi:hypothetical protein